MLNWGIAGTGPISDTVAAAIRKCPASRLQAVAGRNRDHAEAFGARHGIGSVYSDFDAFLADPAIDVVYVGLPNHIHHDLTVRAATAGKHVLCEKSLSVDMTGTEAMLGAVRECGIFFVEGLMYLSHPVMAAFDGFLHGGRLGRLKSVFANYTDDAAHLVNPAGRGAIYNIGCYPVSLLRWVVEVACGAEAFADRTMAALGNISDRDGNVCEAGLTIRFGNGLLASLQTAETHGLHHEFIVVGERGSVRFVTNPWLPGPGPNTFVWSPFGGPSETITVEAEDDAFFYQVQRVERAIAAGRTEAEAPAPTWAASRAIMVLLTTWEAEVRRTAGDSGVSP